MVSRAGALSYSLGYLTCTPHVHSHSRPTAVVIQATLPRVGCAGTLENAAGTAPELPDHTRWAHHSLRETSVKMPVKSVGRYLMFPVETEPQTQAKQCSTTLVQMSGYWDRPEGALLNPSSHGSPDTQLWAKKTELPATAAEPLPAPSSSNKHERNPLVSACLLLRYVQRSVVKFVELFILNTSESYFITRLHCSQSLVLYIAGTVEIP